MRAVLFGCALLLASCGAPLEEVVVYASADEEYVSTIFAAFEKETSIHVRALYDTEEAKTLGLAHRILAEKDRPQCDVFWNGECLRTVLLKKKGVLEPYRPPTAADIPAKWRDPDGTWTGFGARGRSIVYNTARVKNPPHSLMEFSHPRWKGRAAIANPMFGTTAAHVAALAQNLGETITMQWLQALRANDIVVVGGNSHVRDLVATGACDIGLTDHDDIWVGKDRGNPIETAPDLDPLTNFFIPNTAALIRKAPHPANARRFLDWLLRPETEEMLQKGPSRQLSVRKLPKDLESLPVDWDHLTNYEPFLAKAKETLAP